MPIAAIYLPAKGDPYYHATLTCESDKPPGRKRVTARHRVNTQTYAEALGRKRCPECWYAMGYLPELEWLEAA